MVIRFEVWLGIGMELHCNYLKINYRRQSQLQSQLRQIGLQLSVRAVKRTRDCAVCEACVWGMLKGRESYSVSVEKNHFTMTVHKSPLF